MVKNLAIYLFLLGKVHQNSGGLLLALIVAIFFINKLYGSFDKAVGNRYYMDLETKIEDAARKYINDYNIIDPFNYRISLDTLQSGKYIDNVKDSNGNKCDGYVIVNKLNNINYYNAYISCPNYITTNYEKN